MFNEKIIERLENQRWCFFGITELAIAGAISAGVGAETAGLVVPLVVGAAEGAAGGAGLAALTGGDPGKGALSGAITGGFIPAGGELIGGTAGDVIGGAAGGFLGAEATGQKKPLAATLGGAAAGGLAAATSGSTSGGGSQSGAGAGAASAAPPSVTGYDPLSSIQVPGSLPTSTPATILPSGDVSPSGTTLNDVSNALVPPSGQGPSAVPSASATPGNATAGGSHTGLVDSIFGRSTPPPVGSGPSSVNPIPQVSAESLPPPPLAGSTGTGSYNADLVDSVGSQLTAAPAKAAGSGPNIVTQGLTDLGVGSKTADILGKAAPYLPSVGGLALSAFQGNQKPAGLDNIENTANTLSGQAAQLEGYLNKGTLPPGIQESLSLAANNAKTAIRAQYAARGMSGSSAESDALAGVDQRIAAEGGNIALSLLQQGVSENNIAAGLYRTIMDQSIAQDQQLGSAIGNFAAAIAGAPASRAA